MPFSIKHTFVMAYCHHFNQLMKLKHPVHNTGKLHARQGQTLQYQLKVSKKLEKLWPHGCLGTKFWGVKVFFCKFMMQGSFHKRDYSGSDWLDLLLYYIEVEKSFAFSLVLSKRTNNGKLISNFPGWIGLKL